MRVIAFMNGWSDAPHCWPYHLRRGVTVRRQYGGMWTVEVFGLLWWVEFSRRD